MSWLVCSFLPGSILCSGLEDERSWRNEFCCFLFVLNLDLSRLQIVTGYLVSKK